MKEVATLLSYSRLIANFQLIRRNYIMQTLTINHFGRELTMEELDFIAGGIDWGVVIAGVASGALGGAKLGSKYGVWAGVGGAALGGAIGGAVGAASTWND